MWAGEGAPESSPFTGSGSGGWIRTRSVARNQVPICSFHLHAHRSQVQPLPCLHLQGLAAGWAQSLVPPQLEGCEARIWLQITPSSLFFPSLGLSSTVSSLAPHCSQPLFVEFPNPTRALMFCSSSPSPLHSSYNLSIPP